MDRFIRLYTIQKAGYAIALRQYPSQELVDEAMTFHTILFRMGHAIGINPWYQVAQYLGWASWISCLERIRDYDSPWFALEKLVRGHLWTLSVPVNKIQWCSLDAQGENRLPVQEWFFPNPEMIRKHGETPHAFVEAPLNPDYLEKVEPAEEAFEREGLWSDTLEDLIGDDNKLFG